MNGDLPGSARKPAAPAPQGGGRDAAGGNEVPRRRCPGRVGHHRWRGWPEAIGPAVLRPRRRSGGTVSEEVAALAASPLVTPTGLGGSRKTRLATQCQAVEIYDAFARRWPMLKKYGSARLQQAGPKGVFRYRTAGRRAFSLTCSTTQRDGLSRHGRCGATGLEVVSGQTPVDAADGRRGHGGKM
jgi:hypothetical protein